MEMFLDDTSFTEFNTPFIGFAIKIVMSGSNQAQFPRFSDIRAIALR